MRKGLWRQDWFAGLAISLLFLVIANHESIQGLERIAYDYGMRASAGVPGNEIAIIAIDDQSIDNLGRWPWPRDKLANMITKLQEGGAKVIGNTIFFSEPQIDPGLKYINELIALYRDAGLVGEANPGEQKLLEARMALDTDAILARSFAQAGNVVTGIQLKLSLSCQSLGRPGEIPPFISANSLQNIQGSMDLDAPCQAESLIAPIPAIGNNSAGLGHLNIDWDTDGAVRSELLAIDYYGNIIPSLSLVLAAQSLNLGVEDIHIAFGKEVKLGNLTIATDPISRMYPFFYQAQGNQAPFPVDSFFDVAKGNIPVEKYKNKIVLIGITATGLGRPFITPVSTEGVAPVVFLAHVVASILNQDFFIIPEWAGMAENLAFLLIALYLILVLPRLSAAPAAIISLTLLAALLGGSHYFIVKESAWIALMYPAALLLGGYLLLTTKRFLVTERGKIEADQASAQSNRTLGLTLQQQGQLDMAFDKFRQCPLDDSMMEPLYNLALDFERKRQFNKAQSVLEYMATHNAGFRDIKEKIKRNKNLQDTVMFGAAGAGQPGTLLLDGDGIQKPMLGRYQVEKELGKGAMGVVYLGKDPKINRTVAIKTLALSQEFEADELDEVKERFFREAETAGRLAHPNIVTIYDAGEEHDLAYIAMEYLQGHDLSRYTKKDNLMPIHQTLQIIILSAEALQYAHEQNIVHRDIKPANVMLLPKSATIKLTDFGIARITDSSKTKTGMILGTPSYMSPEQLRGAKNLDGRSDLFSLGVMLYQLLCGELPFQGDSMATLMYKIANETHPLIADINPTLAEKAPCVVPILDKALEKSPENRYQTGERLARDLRNCLKNIKKK